jgi:polysaccharide export outer membrane protein
MKIRNYRITSCKILFLLAGIAAYVCYPADCRAEAQAQTADSRKEGARPAPDKPAAEGDTEDEFFKTIYRNFYDTYRLGPGDEVAIRVQGQPDYSLDKVKISPVGQIYHPLAGDIEVAGLTVAQLKKKLTADFSEYIVNPKVSVTLEQAQSAKLGVLGEVKAPGVVLMSRPMSILDVISASGGFTETAKRTDVTVLRQTRDGRSQKLKVNLKRILDGKSGPEENLMMQAGDTVIVDSSTRKKMNNVMSLLGFANFVSFIALGR